MALNFTKLEIMNGIDAHLNITSEVTLPCSVEIPTHWTDYTILDAPFNGNLRAGNLDFDITQLDTILVKRRELGTQTWITVCEVPIAKNEDLSFTRIDRLCGIGTYEYALVPSLNGTEGQYTIIEVESLYQGIFLCDKDHTFRFLGNVEYGSTEQVGIVGVHEPFGSKYPYVVSNSMIDYKRLSLSGLLLPNSFYDNGQVDAKTNKQLLDSLMSVLSERKPKILKDQAGNIWMVQVSGGKSIGYDNRMGMRVATVSIPLTEMGDVTSQKDMTKYGFVVQ